MNCAQPNFSVGVEFIGIGAANITLVGQPYEAGFSGPVTLRVYCVDQDGADIGDVAGSQVAITTNVPNTTFDGQPATFGSPAIIDLALGRRTIVVFSTDPGLAPGVAFARVGSQVSIATLAFGQKVPDGYAPSVGTNIFARTPELSSIALLASGGAGALGYVVVAARARRRRG